MYQEKGAKQKPSAKQRETCYQLRYINLADSGTVYYPLWFKKPSVAKAKAGTAVQAGESRESWG